MNVNIIIGITTKATAVLILKPILFVAAVVAILTGVKKSGRIADTKSTTGTADEKDETNFSSSSLS